MDLYYCSVSPSSGNNNLENMAALQAKLDCCDKKRKKLEKLSLPRKAEEEKKKPEALPQKLEEKKKKMENPPEKEKTETMVPGVVLTPQAEKLFFAEHLPLSGSYQLKMAVFLLRRLWRWWCVHAPEKIGSNPKYTISLVSNVEFLNIFSTKWMPCWNGKFPKPKQEKQFKKLFKNVHVYTRNGVMQTVRTVPNTEGVVWVCSDGQIVIPQMFIQRGEGSITPLTELGMAQQAILNNPDLNQADKEEIWKNTFGGEVANNRTGNHYRNRYIKASRPYGQTH